MIKISNIEEAAKAVVDTESSPDDWRACDFMSLVNLTEEIKK